MRISRLFELVLQGNQLAVIEVGEANGRKDRKYVFPCQGRAFRKTRTTQENTRSAFAQLSELRGNASASRKTRKINALQIHGKAKLGILHHRICGLQFHFPWTVSRIV